MNPLELAWWRLRAWVRHPRLEYALWRKWRNRPGIGDVVEDCRGKLCTVESIGPHPDDLTFTDGRSASWMHCCDWPDGENGRA